VGIIRCVNVGVLVPAIVSIAVLVLRVQGAGRSMIDPRPLAAG
jgi:hypothetical protein